MQPIVDSCIVYGHSGSEPLVQVARTGQLTGAGALECELQLQAQLPGRPWITLWACSVLFTDEPARAQRLQGLATQQRRRLAAQHSELQSRLDERSAVRADVCVCG